MARGDPQINLRINESLKEQLSYSALRSGRTITAEASYLLRVGLEEAMVSLDDIKAMEAKIEQLDQKINEQFEKLEILILNNK